MKSEKYTEAELQQKCADLAKEAITFGATDSAVIPSGQIQVKDSLAALCNGSYTCPNYGRGMSCPPHVEGPEEFRKWQARSRYSIIVKIELPTSVLFSEERRDVMKLLHHIVAAVELKAVTRGWGAAKGFAGGSCKDLFCSDQGNCCVLAENKDCLHRDEARPSMSGFGIDVMQMMRTAGWEAAKAENVALSDNENDSWLAGLVMLARSPIA